MPPKKKIFHDSDSEPEDIDSEQEGSVVSDDVDDLVEESDDDGAPDDVTFVQSKADALRKVKDALTTIGREKERQKDKRRLRDDQFKQQKKQKLDDLSKCRLPDVFLETIASTPVQTEVEEQAATEAGDGDISEPELDDGASDVGSDDSGFIPLGGSEVKAVCINEQSKTSLMAIGKLEGFREKLLYGGKIRRIPEKVRQSLSTKRRARHQ